MKLLPVQRSDGISQVKLIGKLDVVGLHEVDIKFHGYTAAAARPCIVDMAEVEFIASLGIGMLVSCAQSLRRKGTRMVLLNPQELVETTLRATGIHQMIPIVKTEEEALQGLGIT
jgi:anti-anti-sigma factor